MASDPAKYQVIEYYRYLPKKIYIQTHHIGRYYDELIAANPTLAKNDIVNKWSIFKCNLELTDCQENIEQAKSTNCGTKISPRFYSTIYVLYVIQIEKIGKNNHF